MQQSLKEFVTQIETSGTLFQINWLKASFGFWVNPCKHFIIRSSEPRSLKMLSISSFIAGGKFKCDL